jgi:hypothetical protein
MPKGHADTRPTAGRWLDHPDRTYRATKTIASRHERQLIGQTQSPGMDAKLTTPIKRPQST